MLRVPLVDSVVAAVDLCEVVVLEVGVEGLKELIESDHGLIG